MTAELAVNSSPAPAVVRRPVGAGRWRISRRRSRRRRRPRRMKRAVGMAMLVAVVAVLTTGTGAFASNQNGKGGDMPAYYDSQLFTINFKLLKPDLHKNPSFNIIYQCDACADQGLNFISVLD